MTFLTIQVGDLKNLVARCGVCASGDDGGMMGVQEKRGSLPIRWPYARRYGVYSQAPTEEMRIQASHAQHSRQCASSESTRYRVGRV